MNIDREKYQGDFEEAKKRVKFCLDQLEKAKGFARKIDWSTEIVPRLTIEEVIGALVSAEQEIMATSRRR